VRAGAAGVLLASGLACASYAAQPEPYLDPWVGRNERALLDAWGFPDQRYPTAHWEFFVYRSQLPAVWRWFDTGLRCEISFGLYRDEVSVTSWSGEAWICARLAKARPPSIAPPSGEARR
jgi:hypothetical protein